MGADVFGLLGTTVDEKIRVDEQIGEGGFAVVYRGYHLAFEQPVAIKCLKTPAHFDDEAQEAFLAKFRDEGKMLFRLSQHASIVRVFDIGTVATAKGVRVPYLALEWLDGDDLDTMLRRRLQEGAGPYDETSAIALLRPAVDAIALAHRLGIAHRDLKPANLVLANTVQGEVLKVLDFGIAKAMQEGETAAASQATLTSSGFRAFSPQYAAPEQFRSKRYGATGPWTDVHAIGLILVELVTGQPAMVGDEQADFYEQSVGDERPTPRARGFEATEAFERLCARCLARDPRERFQDAEQLLAALDAFSLGVHDMMGASGENPIVVAPKPSPSTSVAVAVTGGPRINPQAATMPAPLSDDAPSPPVSASSTATGAQGTRRALPWIVGGAVVALAAVVGIALVWLPARARAKREEAVGSMASIPAGPFSMGAESGAPDQRPVHTVEVAAFEMDITEVTVAAFGLCVEAGACAASDAVHLTSVPEAQLEVWNAFCNWGKQGREQHPMNCVDWDQANAFCSWVGKRLPTEPEWEYAARGGDEQREYPWGEGEPDSTKLNACRTECTKMALSQGWKWKAMDDAEDAWPTTSPVGSFTEGASRWGQADLAGNVWEWTADDYCPYSPAAGETCPRKNRVARGGGWASRYPGIFRTSFRVKYPPGYRSQDVGFRCARTPSAAR